jgi:hypothetical protein
MPPPMGLGGPAPAAPSVPDFGAGMRMAAGGPQDVGDIPAAQPAGPAPEAGAPAPVAASHAEVYGATAKKYQDIADQLRPFDPEQAKVWDARAKDIVGKMNFKTMKNADGEDTGVFVNEANPNETPMPFTPGDTAVSPNLIAAIKSGVKGKDFETLLEKTSPVDYTAVKKMIAGDIPPPANVASTRNPKIQKWLAYAEAIEPGFGLERWSARNAAMKSFYGSGKDSDTARSLVQALHHVGSLITTGQDLGNTNYPWINTLKNLWTTATGGGDPGAFETNAHAVADEIGKIFKGANLSDTEIEAWGKQLHANMSPEQQRKQMGKLMELLHGGIDSLEKKRIDALGPDIVAEKGPLLGVRAQDILKRVEDWKSGGKFEPLPEIPQEAKTELIKRKTTEDPAIFEKRRAQFDKYFGNGASDEILGDYR